MGHPLSPRHPLSPDVYPGGAGGPVRPPVHPGAGHPGVPPGHPAHPGAPQHPAAPGGPAAHSHPGAGPPHSAGGPPTPQAQLPQQARPSLGNSYPQHTRSKLDQ